MGDLKQLHEQAGEIVAAAKGRLITTTCGTLGQLVEATRLKLPPASDSRHAQLIDSHKAFSNAAKTNAGRIVCRVAADRVLYLTTLLFGALVTTERKPESIVMILQPLPETEN